jgi:predicted Zn-dependent protease
MLLDDSATAAYVQRLTGTVLQNSDSQFPVTVRVVDSPDVYAVTLPGWLAVHQPWTTYETEQ